MDRMSLRSPVLESRQSPPSESCASCQFSRPGCGTKASAPFVSCLLRLNASRAGGISRPEAAPGWVLPPAQIARYLDMRNEPGQ